MFIVRKKIKILILLIILILIGSFIFISRERSSLSNFPPLKNEKQEESQATLEINGVKYQSQIEGEISIADFMEKLKSEGKISFIEKNYIGMGKFIEEINGIKNSGDKNWIYYVNNKKANIGISNYKINQGDIVSWKYEK